MKYTLRLDGKEVRLLTPASELIDKVQDAEQLYNEMGLKCNFNVNVRVCDVDLQGEELKNAQENNLPIAAQSLVVEYELDPDIGNGKAFHGVYVPRTVDPEKGIDRLFKIALWKIIAKFELSQEVDRLR
jgi:hypothetical protein